MLGRLRLTVDDALKYYCQFVREVWPKNWNLRMQEGTFEAKKFEEAIKKIVESSGTAGSAEERMQDPRPPDAVSKTYVGCYFWCFKHNLKLTHHSFVCAMPALSVSGPRLFRTYSVWENPCYDCTIWQAARATSAAPAFFDPIIIGEEGSEETFIHAGFGYHNPIRQVLEEADILFGPHQPVACIISIGAGQAESIELPSPDAFRRVPPDNLTIVLERIATDCELLAEDFEGRLKHVENVYFRFNVQRGVSLAECERDHEVYTYTSAYIESSGASQRVNVAVETLRRPPAVVSITELSM